MIKRGTIWDGCIMISEKGTNDILNEDSRPFIDAHREALTKCYGEKQANYEVKENNLWLDTRHNIVFCQGQYHFPGKLFGKDHHFYVKKDRFDFHTKHHMYKRIVPQNEHLNKQTYTQIDHHLIYGDNGVIDFEKYKGKSVKIIGGGPSTATINWENIDTDYTWSCNQFYKNERVAKQKIDLVSMSADTPRAGFKSIGDICRRDGTNTCFLLDWGDFGVNPVDPLYDFINEFPESVFYYHTRYASVIGVGARMVITAILWGAKDIYFVGFDLNSEQTRDDCSAFEKSKSVPPWFLKHGYDFQRRHLIIFWDYIMSLRETYDFTLYNLGEHCENNAYTSMSQHLFPLSDEIKEKIR